MNRSAQSTRRHHSRTWEVNHAEGKKADRYNAANYDVTSANISFFPKSVRDSVAFRDILITSHRYLQMIVGDG